MPSSREIEKQNDLLLDQRDIMEEIANLIEDAAVSGEMFVDSLMEARDLTKEIKDNEEEQKKKKKESLTLQEKFNNLLKTAKTKTKDLAKGIIKAGKQVADSMLDALGEIGSILSSVLSLIL